MNFVVGEQRDLPGRADRHGFLLLAGGGRVQREPDGVRTAAPHVPPQVAGRAPGVRVQPALHRR
jgi:hypothetical protein